MLIDINGVKTNYIIKGGETSPTLLLLHGWGCNASVYEGLTDYLSHNYRVYLPELPGFGETSEPAEAFSVGDYAEFITAFCQALNLSPEVIIAHSLGCRIAIKLLSETSPALNPVKVIFTGAAGIKPKRSLKSRINTRTYKIGRAIMTLPPLKKLFPDAIENMRNKRGSADYKSASPVMRQTLVKIVNEDLTSLLPAVKNSVLLIWGENDDSTPLADGRLMESSMPDAGLAVIKGAGHYAFLENPTLFNRIADVYLKGGG